MDALPLPLTRELVLIGGGHTHALVLRRWGMTPLPGGRLTVINPDPTAPYTGMLPGHVAGHYPREALEIDLVRLTRFAGARLILGRVDAIDREARRVHVTGRGWIGYDIASLDIGITSDLPDLPGFAAHAIAAKPLGPFADAWAVFREGDGPAEIAVIGGGVGGLELAMAMAHALGARGRPARVRVIEAETPAQGLGPAAKAKLMAAVQGHGIEVLAGTPAARVTEDAVILADGRAVPSRFTVGVAGARPQDWLRDTGLDLTRGFVTVDPFLRSVSDPAIYAAGDCAHLAHAPRPKAGVFAVRAAPILAHNLRADLSRGVRRRFAPQRDYLKLISLGGRRALGEKWGLVTTGDWIWRQKDRIDRRFMDRLNALPRMAPPPPPREAARDVAEALHGGQALCGGCGAKVAPAPLARVLAAQAATHPDVLTGPGDDAAIVRVGGVRQVLTTDHLRAVTSDPHLMARIAAVHALGDVWAMGAQPQAVLASLILPPLSERLSEGWLTEIMEAAGGVFAAEGAAIVGGHTTQGAELTIGFAITGLLDGPAITLAGARPGDVLILTKPVGAGVLLAAEMQGKARGDDIAALWAAMVRPQGDAAALLSGAHAMTDVTGFGLAGHLMAMLDASGVGAEVDLAAVPVHPGAEALAARGIRSTLFDQNRAAVEDRVRAPEGPRADLLFDPQTCGGLLAAVPGDQAARLVADLRTAGVPAARIGRITDDPPRITVR
ncbi:selenide, water dikinase SelD [Palleronia sp. KMU-117]|uniref:selenide, water dikinase SelD n=1 Tax=Palleronia sp. KMU-117 TaxID=3434108 RepID=UPI003D732D81